jgi:hypothetical protein
MIPPLLCVSGVSAWPVSCEHQSNWSWLRGYGRNVNRVKQSSMTCTRIPENEIDASTFELIRVSRVTTWPISCGRGNRWGGCAATVGTSSRWVMENDMRTKAMKPGRQLDNGFDQRVTRDRVAEFTGAFKQDNAAAGHAATGDTRVNAATIQRVGAACVQFTLFCMHGRSASFDAGVPQIHRSNVARTRKRQVARSQRPKTRRSSIITVMLREKPIPAVSTAS